MKKLSLDRVSLICVTSTDIEASLFAMIESVKNIDFADRLLITSESSCNSMIESISEKYSIRILHIEPLRSINEYSAFLLKDLHKYFSSDYCLIMQWDGWIINYNYWDQKFLDYDYIGAVWPKEIWPEKEGFRVGNGGFSLRSKKLCIASNEILNLSKLDLKNIIEDQFLAETHRRKLESEFNIKFAPEKIAEKFSIERGKWNDESFGFHGFFNFNKVFDDQSLKAVINKLELRCFSNILSYDLVKNLISEKRFELAKIVLNKRFESTGFTKKNIRLNFFWLYKKVISL